MRLLGPHGDDHEKDDAQGRHGEIAEHLVALHKGQAVDDPEPLGNPQQAQMPQQPANPLDDLHNTDETEE